MAEVFEAVQPLRDVLQQGLMSVQDIRESCTYINDDLRAELLEGDEI